MTIARLLAYRRILLNLLMMVEDDLRARGWQRGHDASTTEGRRV